MDLKGATCKKKQTSMFDQLIIPRRSCILSKPKLYSVKYYEAYIKP